MALFPLQDVVTPGKFCAVKMTDEGFKLLHRQPPPVRARFTRWMKQYSINGQRGLSGTKLREEGEHSLGNKSDKSVRIQAFGDNTTTHRAYGSLVTLDSQLTFLCTLFREKKKKGKALQNDLRLTAERIGKVLEQ